MLDIQNKSGQMPDILYTTQIHIKVHIQKAIGNLYVLIEGKSKNIRGKIIQPDYSNYQVRYLAR